MIFGLKNRVKSIGCHVPLYGQQKIMYICQFSYLGDLLDAEVTLKTLHKNVMKQTEHKLFALGEIRYCITKDSAIKRK